MEHGGSVSGLLVFCLRLTDDAGHAAHPDDGAWTQLLAALIGFVEVTIFVVAISRVIRNGKRLERTGFRGFAAGTLVGMTIEGTLPWVDQVRHLD